MASPPPGFLVQEGGQSPPVPSRDLCVLCVRWDRSIRTTSVGVGRVTGAAPQPESESGTQPPGGADGAGREPVIQCFWAPHSKSHSTALDLSQTSVCPEQRVHRYQVAPGRDGYEENPWSGAGGPSAGLPLIQPGNLLLSEITAGWPGVLGLPYIHANVSGRGWRLQPPCPAAMGPASLLPAPWWPVAQQMPSGEKPVHGASHLVAAILRLGPLRLLIS